MTINPKYSVKLKKILTELFDMNEEAINDDDDEVKSLTCILIEILQNNVELD